MDRLRLLPGGRAAWAGPNNSGRPGRRAAAEGTHSAPARSDPAPRAPGAEIVFDEVIDVRSPSEFAEDHLPGSVSLPVLDDAERAEVGTIYVQEDKFKARKIGAALVSRNIAAHLKAHFAAKPRDYRPLVLCWRGGQRSGAMALVLEQIGWRVGVLDGGYRAYRRRVVERLYHAEPWFEAVLLGGPTGVGKTEVLRRLAERGWPTLDLEGLARHRGSVFGGQPGPPQPTQKRFEGAVLASLDAAAAAAGPVVIEAESSKIGDLLTPPVLWKAMLAAPRLTLEAPLEARARFLTREYASIAEDRAALDGLLLRLTPVCGGAQVDAWRALASAGDLQGLARGLIENHYDPAYRRSARKRADAAQTASAGGSLGAVSLKTLERADFDAAADQIIALLRRRTAA